MTKYTELRRLTGQITRPANTTQYAANRNLADSTSGTTVNWLTFSLPMGVRSAKAFALTVLKSTTTLTDAEFRVHLFSEAPVAKIADAAALSALDLAENAYYIGSYHVLFARTLGNFAIEVASPEDATHLNLIPDTNEDVEDSVRVIYAVVETLDTYTPGNAEVFDFVLTVEAELED